jgi:hypothetical protein
VPEGPQAVRSVVAVGAGFFATQLLALGADLLFGPLAGQASNVLLVRLACVAAFEALGGYITARLAIRNPVRHALVLGLLMLVMGVLVAVFTWDGTLWWYQISALVLTVPLTMLGGVLEAKRKKT